MSQEQDVASFHTNHYTHTGEGHSNKSMFLQKQNLETLNVETLHPLAPEVISRQATINIGTIGHVAHGKSTVVKAISGVKTVRFKKELVSNITIKLGYANAKIFHCDEMSDPEAYFAAGSGTPDTCPHPTTGKPSRLVRHVSFVDCPGHDILMATMLNGAAVMDAALLLIAGNEPCPQPQTSEHLAAVEIMKLKHVIILQNKIDLVKEPAALQQHDDIKRFLKGSVAESSPIVPISAQLKYNIDVICEYLCRFIPVPKRDFSASPRLIVVRSFDVNKPGEEVPNLRGGVAGGSIVMGVLRLGQEIEIRPGIMSKTTEGQMKCTPIRSRVVSLFAEENELQYAVPGGLIGVGTKIDPTLTRADRLVGQVLGAVGKLPEIFTELEISFYLLRRLLGVKPDPSAASSSSAGVSNSSSSAAAAAAGGASGGAAANSKIQKLAKGEILMLNIGSMSTGGRIVAVKNELAKLALTNPVCTEIGEKLALSRRVEKHWRLIGWGQIRRGTQLEPENIGTCD